MNQAGAGRLLGRGVGLMFRSPRPEDSHKNVPQLPQIRTLPDRAKETYNSINPRLCLPRWCKPCPCMKHAFKKQALPNTPRSPTALGTKPRHATDTLKPEGRLLSQSGEGSRTAGSVGEGWRGRVPLELGLHKITEDIAPVTSRAEKGRKKKLWRM